MIAPNGNWTCGRHIGRMPHVYFQKGAYVFPLFHAKFLQQNDDIVITKGINE
jgi:hypothetical protein